MFAISATAAGADDTYKRMLNYATKIIEEYGTEKLQYGIIIYGRNAVVRRKLGDSFLDDKTLKLFIRNSSREIGGSALDKALQQAKELFNPANGGRTEAEKVLVVITDNMSTGSSSVARATATELREEGVRIIAVLVGNQADPMVGTITSVKDDIIRERKNQRPSVVAKKIMERVKGEIYLSFTAVLC